MSEQAFPIDREHPPREIRYRGAPRDFVLRPWAMEDIEAQVALVHASMAELRAFMPWVHTPVTLESQYQVRRRFQAAYWEGREFVLGVFDEKGAPLGGCGLHPRTPLNPAALEIGFWCGTAFSGRGLTTQVTRCLIALSFDWLGADRVQICHDTANDKSRRVAEKCGFRSEGTQRKAVAAPSQQMRDQGYIGTTNVVMYALVREDLASLDWLEATREGMTLIDALGKERAHVSFTSK
jgi:RimJ/RimL family protein N-acetyltransferase